MTCPVEVATLLNYMSSLLWSLIVVDCSVKWYEFIHLLYYKALGCNECSRKLCVVSKHWIAYWILQLICGKIGCMRSQIPVPSRQTNTKTITGCGGKIRHSAAVWRNLDDSVKNSHCMQLFVSIFKIVSTLTTWTTPWTMQWRLLLCSCMLQFGGNFRIWWKYISILILTKLYFYLRSPISNNNSWVVTELSPYRHLLLLRDYSMLRW